MSTVTLCDGCLDEIEETVCQHQTGDWCAECCRCGECLLDLADDAADDLLTTHWKGEL
jgi:hypothetical protein